MIGKHQIEITGSQLATGLATADNLNDGFIGSGSQNLSPFAAQGEIYSTQTESVTGLSGGLVASAPEWQTAANLYNGNRWFVDTSRVYVANGGTITQVLSGGSFLSGTTDMAAFTDGSTGTALYITTATDISQVIYSAGSYSLLTSWWHTTKSETSLTSGVPHPLLVWQNALWIGDGQYLHKIAADGTVSTKVLTLDATEAVMCLEIDPNTGLMLIGIKTVHGSGFSLSFPSQNYISLYDGYSAYVRRKVPISAYPVAFASVGGRVYVSMDNMIGLWNGVGVSFVRRFATQAGIKKHQLAAIGNILFVADGATVYAYGEILSGELTRKSWFPVYTAAGDINVLYENNYSALVVNADSSHLIFVNHQATVGTETGILITNNITFPRPVFIRKMRVFTSGISTTTGAGGAAILDENGISHAPSVSHFVVTSGTKYVFDFDYAGLKLQLMQPKITIDTKGFSITRIIIYYDAAE